MKYQNLFLWKNKKIFFKHQKFRALRLQFPHRVSYVMIADMRFTIGLIFAVSVIVFVATASTILNRATGPLPSFDEPLNVPPDPNIGTYIDIIKTRLFKYIETFTLKKP